MRTCRGVHRENTGAFGAVDREITVLVDDVVDDLEQQPELLAELPPRQLVGNRNLGSPQRAPDGCREQPPGLQPVQHREIVHLAVDVEMLAADHAECRLRELARHFGGRVAGGLAEAFRQASRYPTAEVARELAEATLGMIGGQHLDIHGEVHDLAVLHRLKTGRLFAASVGCALWAAEVPLPDQLPWREFGEELGLLFQIVDDVIDEDGYFAIHGAEGARALALDAAARAHERLAAIDADTSVLGEIGTDLAVRTK